MLLLTLNRHANLALGTTLPNVGLAMLDQPPCVPSAGTTTQFYPGSSLERSEALARWPTRRPSAPIAPPWSPPTRVYVPSLATCDKRRSVARGCLILTLGLFTFVVNAQMLILTSWIAEGMELAFRVDGFRAAFLAALIVSVVSFTFNHLIAKRP